MKEYPFIKCLHPVATTNPYTNERIVVPCGKCLACQNQKADIQTLKCRLESKSHRYCFFVTLTYSENNVPRMVKFETNLPGVYSFKDDTIRFKKYKDLYRKELHPGFPLSDVMLSKLDQKFQNNRYAYLCKKDVQLFVKRLRKNLLKYSDEKIRYYACGEYGPKHFRPHYHLLLWFSKDETFSSLRKAIRESWKLGSIRTYLAKNAAQYVAGYVNSTCVLPKLFKDNAFKQFCCHSSRLGETILKSKVQAVFETNYQSIVKHVQTFGNVDTDVFMWRSLKTWFFPKCRAFNSISFGEYQYAYTLYATAQSWTREVSPFRQAKFIVEHIYEHGFNHFIDEYQTLLNYFRSDCRFSTKKYCRCDKDVFEQVFRSIYHDLYISHHFLMNVCERPDGHIYPSQKEINKKILFIYQFYKKENYENLKTTLTNQQLLINSDLYKLNPDNDVFDYFYDNLYYDIEVFNNSLLPRMFEEDTYKRSMFRVKHKEQNDANKIFFNS